MDIVGVPRNLFYRFSTVLATSKGNIHTCIYPQFFKLPTSRQIQVGFDQSTSVTGMCVKSYPENELICIISFINKGVEPQAYTLLLKNTLTNMLSGTKVRRIVLESHGGIGTNKYVNRVLKNLYDMLRDLGTSLGSLKETEFATETPPGWRSAYIPKSKYSGKYTSEVVKLAVVEESLIRYPNLEKCVAVSPDSYDNFEALGVLDGYNSRNFTEEGVRLITKALHLDKLHEYFSVTERMKDNSTVSVAQLLKKHSTLIDSKGYAFFLYNKGLTAEENIRRATTNTNSLAMILVTDKRVCRLIAIRENIDLQDDEHFVLLAYRLKEKPGLVFHKCY